MIEDDYELEVISLQNITKRYVLYLLYINIRTANRNNKQDLPTPLSPMSKILKK